MLCVFACLMPLWNFNSFWDLPTYYTGIQGGPTSHGIDLQLDMNRLHPLLLQHCNSTRSLLFDKSQNPSFLSFLFWEEAFQIFGIVLNTCKAEQGDELEPKSRQGRGGSLSEKEFHPPKKWKSRFDALPSSFYTVIRPQLTEHNRVT